MGIFDKALARLAGEIVKATPGTTAGYGLSVPLEREQGIASVPFSPAMPLIPSSINALGERGKPDPRRWEFEVAQNINVTSSRLIPFKTLRVAADQIDILRRCIEVLKNKMAALDWDIVLSADAVNDVASEAGVSQVRAAQLAKDKFTNEMAQAKKFWETPDIANGLTFRDWLTMALEEILVLDAWAVWPQQTVGGELRGLQILDGGTIKPLIDARGMRPEAPNAAFQQILFGFPRSEFSAPTETLELDGVFSSDELSYLVRNRRTTSVYGFGPVERALPLADIYLRRQQWLRSEFTDGVMPEVMFLSDGTFPPEQKRYWENILNDDLAGQTEQRHRATVIPAGMNPVFPPSYDQKFNDTFDEFLITSICGHFGVQPSEIGYTPKSGLGGAGHQDGQAESSEVIGLLPLAEWVASQITQLSYVFLGMPRELEFKFQPSARHDAEAKSRADDIDLKNGSVAINEVRAERGLPLLESDVADTPLIVTGTGVYMVTADGLVDATGMGYVNELGNVDATGETPAPETAQVEQQANFRDRAEALGTLIRAGVKPTDAAHAVGFDGLEFLDAMPVTLKPSEMLNAETQALSDTKPASTEPAPKSAMPDDVAEMRRFVKWLRKSPTKPFQFDFVPTDYAETLNKFVAVGDHDGARWYADRYLG